MFVTLDSSVGKIYLPKLEREAFITDTIGFVQNLPTDLIDAFTSTLLETVNADLLLHVIDISDSQMVEKIAVVENILKNLKLQTKKQIYVFNKVELATNDKTRELKEQFASFHPQFISAKTGDGTQELVETIQKELM